ncbi:MAG: hypothetical protein OEQ18_06685 [Gammaproteobacteria bacterium]|nr:hypothetical protein [Gammaproteobacteria bacterium]
MSDKTTRPGPQAIKAPGKARVSTSSPVRVYSAAGAVQVGARVVTADSARKPAWRRDDIDYDCYLID